MGGSTSSSSAAGGLLGVRVLSCCPLSGFELLLALRLERGEFPQPPADLIGHVCSGLLGLEAGDLPPDPKRQAVDVGSEAFSQKELTDRAGTSHSAISRIESGRYGITLDTLQRIAQALGVDLILTFETGGWKRARRSVRLERP